MASEKQGRAKQAGGKKIPPAEMLRGAMLAFDECVSILDDAQLALLKRRFPRSVMLSVNALEELGRGRLLFEKSWEHHQAGTEATIEEVRNPLQVGAGRSSAHIGKLSAGIVNLSFSPPPEVMERFFSADEESRARGQAEMNELIDKVLTEDKLAKEVHAGRLKANYVDLKDDGTWSTPSQVDDLEALNQWLQVMRNACAVLQPVCSPGVKSACAGFGINVDWSKLERIASIGPYEWRQINAGMFQGIALGTGEMPVVESPGHPYHPAGNTQPGNVFVWRPADKEPSES